MSWTAEPPHILSQIFKNRMIRPFLNAICRKQEDKEYLRSISQSKDFECKSPHRQEIWWVKRHSQLEVAWTWKANRGRVMPFRLPCFPVPFSSPKHAPIRRSLNPSHHKHLGYGASIEKWENLSMVRKLTDMIIVSLQMFGCWRPPYNHVICPRHP